MVVGLKLGTVDSINYERGFGVIVGKDDATRRSFDLTRDVIGECPWPKAQVTYAESTSAKKPRATRVTVISSRTIPPEKQPIAEKIMKATRMLAELQEGRQRIRDGVGFGNAHWKLGLILADMWDCGCVGNDPMSVVKGAAYLLFRHPQQAHGQNVSDKMIGVFLPYAEQRKEYLDTVRHRSSSLVGKWVRWKLFDENGTYLQLTASSGASWQAIESAARYLGLVASQEPGGIVLRVEEAMLPRLMQFAGTSQGLRLRACMEVGRKMLFDQLSERFHPHLTVQYDISEARVSHPIFGVGQALLQEGAGNGAKLHVEFSNGSKRWLRVRDAVVRGNPRPAAPPTACDKNETTPASVASPNDRNDKSCQAINPEKRQGIGQVAQESLYCPNPNSPGKHKEPEKPIHDIGSVIQKTFFSRVRSWAREAIAMVMG